MFTYVDKYVSKDHIYFLLLYMSCTSQLKFTTDVVFLPSDSASVQLTGAVVA